MYEETMLCLASSRKPPSGRCIAGKIFARGGTKGWIRPVSARASHEVSEEERRYHGGKLTQLLDIVTVPLLRASPLQHQIENHVLDDSHYWEKQGSATWQQVTAAEDLYDAAFWSYSLSTKFGQNDKVHSSFVGRLGSSLKLVLVRDLTIQVQLEEGFGGNHPRRRVRGRFTTHGKPYLMSVSDPEVEDEYIVKPNGTYPIGEAAICVSVVEVWNDYAFRVIASVITRQRCGELNAR